jgi:hypothetical protein
MDEPINIDYTSKMFNLAKEHMTDDGYYLLDTINRMVVDIWDRPTSSTGKHHLKSDGTVPSCAHHTYEILYAGTKILHMFGNKPKSPQNDVYVMVIVLHDMLKYGKDGNREHTDNGHDKLIADFLQENVYVLLKHFSFEEVDMIITGVRYHSGRWSTGVLDKDKFEFNSYPPIVMFIHMLDMMSSADLINL